MNKIKNITIGYVAFVLWSFFIAWFMAKLVGQPVYGDNDTDKSILEISMTCIIAPLWEELYYRKLPLTLGKYLDKQFNAGGELLMVAAIFSSIEFGFAHDGGIFSLFMQGVLGMVLCWVYIQNKYSYWSSVAVHAMWNTTVMFLLN
jgi:membrane protease YdiL (CAAX protease family)